MDLLPLRLVIHNEPSIVINGYLLTHSKHKKESCSTTSRKSTLTCIHHKTIIYVSINLHPSITHNATSINNNRNKPILRANNEASSWSVYVCVYVAERNVQGSGHTVQEVENRVYVAAVPYSWRMLGGETWWGDERERERKTLYVRRREKEGETEEVCTYIYRVRNEAKKRTK